MAIELTGPYKCAECGTGITLETALDGDSGPFTVNIRGHVIEVPGLYVCTPCAGAIMVGEKESQVTYEAARDFLNDVYGPKLTEAVFLRGMTDQGTISRLNDVIEVQTLLECLIVLLADDPEHGLDFIDQCTGEHGVHPRDMAAMN